MRLQTVVSEMGVGGAERVVIDVLRDAAERGDALGLLADPGPLDADVADLSIERGALPTGRSPGSVLRSIAASTSFAKRFGPDLVHAHNVRVTGLAWLGGRIAKPLGRPPLVSTYHGVPLEEVAQAARILGRADAVACVSTGLRDQLEQAGVPAHLLSVVPNGVPDAAPPDADRRSRLDAELGIAPGAPVVSIVGRLAPQKAHERFLEATAALRRRVPGVRCLVVGDGERREELERLSEDLGLTGDVLFTGVRSDARDVIARSDLLVFSSVWEGLSIAALEALAAGVPVVSTDVAGTRELLTSGAGTIVPHTAEALADAMAELLESPERRAEMGAEGRRLHADRFSTSRMTAGYRAIYERLLERRARNH